MKINWKQQHITLSACDYEDIDAIFASYFISKKTRHQYYQQGRICINHRVITRNQPVSIQDTIDIHCLDDGSDAACTPCFEPISIVYEDDLFLLVNKPSGMLVHSDGTKQETTLYDLVKGYYIQQGLTICVRAIHRLDKDTTGVIIFCKIAFFQPFLDHLLKEKKIHRTYVALCKGQVSKTNICIQAGIARNRHSSKMRISQSGKEAKTDVHVIKKYKDYTYISCTLHQGRTHQIRVHLASISHPLLSDTLYGTRDSRIDRCALHAQHVTLYHPLLQQQMEITCPLPYDIKRLLK